MTASGITTVQAKICSPTPSSTQHTTFPFSGAASSSKGIQVTQIYVDGVKKAQYSESLVDVNLTLAPGSHRVTFQAIDNGGNKATSTENIAVHDSMVTLSWKPSTSSGVDSYIIYRSLRSGGGYAEAGTSASTAFVDKPGLGTFYYVVVAVSPKGESSYSNQIEAVLK